MIFQVFAFLWFSLLIAPPAMAGCVDSIRETETAWINRVTGINDPFHISNEPSVRLVSEDQNGVVLERVAQVSIQRETVMTWESNYSAKPGAIQGDPRGIALSYGVAVAQVLGMEFLPENRIKIPKRERLREGVQRLNAVLPARFQILMDFYGMKGKRNELRKYLKSAGNMETDNFLFPYEEEYPVIAHDFSFHAKSIAMPNRAAQHAKRIAFLTEQFISFLEKRGLKHSVVALKDVTREMTEHAVANIDVGNGDYGYGITNPHSTRSGFSRFAHSGSAPKEVLKEELRLAVGMVWIRNDDFDRRAEKGLSPTYFNEKILPPFLREFESFIEEYGKPYPWLDQKLNMTAAQFRRETLEKMDAIRRAAESIRQAQ